MCVTGPGWRGIVRTLTVETELIWPTEEGIDPEVYKQRLAALFDTLAPGCDRAALRFFAFAADRMVYRLRLAPGEKVLDVATGTGMVATAAARLVGPSGRVTGIDIAEGMLDQAWENARRQGATNLDMHVMDAEHLEFRSRYFDAVLCGAGIYYLPDMSSALEEWARVLKPGGRLLFTGFSPSAFQPMAGLLLDLLAARGHGRSAGAQPLLWQRLGSLEQYRALLSGAGFGDVRVEAEQLGYHLTVAGDWWEVVWNSDLRRLVEGLPDAELGRLRADHQAAVEGLRTEKGIWMDVATIFASATRPRSD